MRTFLSKWAWKGSRRLAPTRARSGPGFFDVVRKATILPIATGFGISSPEHIRLLRGKADAVVVGSRVIDLFYREGLDGVRAFLEGCRAELTRRVPA